MSKKNKRIFTLLILCSGTLAALGWEFAHINNNLGMSNSSVNVIFQDRQGYLWVGTWDGLNRYDGNEFRLYASVPKDTTTLSHPVVRDIQEEGPDHLWITTDGGINRLNKLTGKSRRYLLNTHPYRHFEEGYFHCAISSQMDVLACVDNGPIYAYDKSQDYFKAIANAHGGRMAFHGNQLLVISDHQVTRYKLHHNKLTVLSTLYLPKGVSALFDNKNQLWCQYTGKGQATLASTTVTAGHVYRLNNRTKPEPMPYAMNDKVFAICHQQGKTIMATDNGIHTFANGHQEAHTLAGIMVKTLFAGTQNILWAGTDGQGIFQYYDKTNYIKSFGVGKWGVPVRAILRMGNQLLVGTKGEGLFVMQEQPGSARPILNRQINVGQGRSNNAVFALTRRVQSSDVWVGTDGKGILYYDGQELRKMRFLHPEDENRIYSVYSIIQHDAHTLFLGTSGNGFVKATIADDLVTQVVQYQDFLPASVAANIVYAMVLDYPYLWAGTRGGGLICMRVRDHSFKIYRSDPSKANTLVSNDIISLYLDHSKRLWIGTSQGLDMMQDLYQSPTLTNIASGSSLTSMNVHHIEEDCFHHIWISTSSGLFRIDNNREIINFNYQDGLQGNEFSDGAGLSADHGHVLYFGGTNGISSISPQQMQTYKFMPRLLLSQMAVDGKEIPLQPTPRIPNGARSIQFNFSILDFINNERCRLSYYVEHDGLFNIDQEVRWTNLANSKRITLNELAPGKYTLVVRQSNHAHQWSKSAIRLTFYIAYPIWQRWWAILTYAIAIVAALRYIYLKKKHRLVKKHQRELEQQGQQARNEIHQAKLRFFSKITNDFSNSITQIYDAIGRMADRQGDDFYPSELEQIRTNIHSMKEQIKQVAEIKSEDEENLPVTPVRFSMPDFVISAMDNYMDVILKKRLQLSIPTKSRLPEIVTDRTILYKAFNYMLRYCFDKCTANGRLEVSCVSPGPLVLSVTYQGLGPTPDEQESIFSYEKAIDRMDDGTSGGNDDAIIGLTISNNLIKKLGGTLGISASIASTTFTLALHNLPVAARKEKAEESRLQKIINKKDKHILIIGDDEQMSNFMSHILSDQYQVIIIPHEDQLESSVTVHTDLIIIDLRDNDYQVINQLKMVYDTRYVPIIAICSEGAKEAHADALAMGVNMLIEKPFTTKYFRAVVDYHIQTLARIRDYSDSGVAYIHRYDANDMSEETRRWLEKAAELLKQHYGDDIYDATSLANDMAISRSQLYRKMRTAINASPNEFILEYRMLQVEKMLKTTSHTVSEIINTCGFHNRSYFYREFAKRYHCLPTAYRKKVRLSAPKP